MVFLFTSCSVLASSTSFAGYIQANNDQDFAMLSTIIGDSTFNVTFSANGQLDFSYFSQHMMKNATLNLVDNNIFEAAGPVNVVAGTFSVSDPADLTFSLSGPLFILPPLFADIPNVKQQASSQVVPSDSVVKVSSLLPVSVNTGCTNCGAVYNGGWTPAPLAPPMPLSPFATAFSIFDATDPAPEPSTVALFGVALIGAGLFQFRRQYFRP
jgi:hypothetical protein